MKQLGGSFDEDPDFFQLLDIVATNYHCLPSDLIGLTWEELLLNVQCLQFKSHRFDQAMRQNRQKKGMIFPNISIMDLVNLP